MFLLKYFVFNKTDIELLNNLKSDPNIGKGEWTVILDKTTFETKLNISNDTDTFKPINGNLFNLIIKLECTFNRILRQIKSNIGEKLYTSLYGYMHILESFPCENFLKLIH